MGLGFNRLVLAVLAVCTGCAPAEQPLTAQVSSAFDAECLTTIDTQNAWWADKLDVPSVFELEVVDELTIDYRSVTIEQKYSPDWVGYASAQYDRRGRLYEGSIWLAPTHCMSAKTVAHEIGHVLGLGHSDGPDDLMNEHSVTGMHLSDAEIELARAALAD